MFIKRLKITFLIMTLSIFILSSYRITAFAADTAEGAFNSSVSWKISGETLTVSGSGEMGDVKNQMPYMEYKDTITTIIIEEGVLSVGNSAFSGFSKLKYVTLPESLEYIDINAFAYCYNLFKINIPDNVHYIGNNAFFGAYFLAGLKDEFLILGNGNLYSYSGKNTAVSIPSGVKSITDRTFVTNKTIKSVFIPTGVKFIGDNAFLDCPNLQYAVLPYDLNTIGNIAFGYILNPAPVLKSDFRLYGYPQTAAETYAASNEISFTYMSDIDADNSITSYDALMILQKTTDTISFTAEQTIQADTDGDGSITSYDALITLNYIVNGTGE